MKKVSFLLLLTLCFCTKQTPTPSIEDFIKREMIGAYLGGDISITTFVDTKVGNNSLVIEYANNPEFTNSTKEKFVLLEKNNSQIVYTLQLDLEPESLYYYKYYTESTISTYSDQEVRQIKTAASKPTKYLTFSTEDSGVLVGEEYQHPFWYEVYSKQHYKPVFYYSYDAEEWFLWEPQVKLTCQYENPLYICGGNRNGFNELYYYNQLLRFYSIHYEIACTGDIMSLLDMNNEMFIIPSEYCFGSLFKEMRLISAPELPATVLTQGCYKYMFEETLITRAPVLPAKELKEDCYEGMFSDCENLSYVKCLAENPSDFKYTGSWLLRVAGNGLFERSPNATWTTGSSGIPVNWEVKSVK